MQHRYIYSGFLNAFVAEQLATLAKQYYAVLELWGLPGDFPAWAQANLTKIDIPDRETGIGRKGVSYALMHNKDVSMFLFLASAEDYDKVVTRYGQPPRDVRLSKEYIPIIKNLTPLTTLV